MENQLERSIIGYGIYDSNIVGFAISIANVTDCDECIAQSNAAVLTAGDSIDIKQYNQNQSQDD